MLNVNILTPKSKSHTHTHNIIYTTYYFQALDIPRLHTPLLRSEGPPIP